MPETPLIHIPETLPQKIGFDAICKAVGRYLFTPEGRAQLVKLQPISDPDSVAQLCHQSAEMMRLLEQDVPFPLEPLEDVSRWLGEAAAEGSRLSIEAFPIIARHARAARLLKDSLVKMVDSFPELCQLTEQLQPQRELEKKIERTIDSDGRIQDRATPELYTIRSQMKEKRGTLRRSIEKLFRKSVRDKMASDEGPTLRGGRMVIPIKSEFRRKVDGFVHDVSASGQTVYIEPVESLQLNNDLRQLEAEEQREIDRILLRLTDAVRSSRRQLFRNDGLIGQLDLIHGRTRFGLSLHGLIPKRSAGQYWRLIHARNPGLLLKQRTKREGAGEGVVPLDLELGVDEHGIVISGPNAGGKSVALKTIALFSCMYQTGIPVPAGKGTELPLITGLFLDMGDDQSIENDLSTFSSRLEWMRRCLEDCTEKSLVLIDEAGTGTDPDEGSALFQAFIEEVLQRRGRLIATTHHGALKVYAHNDPQLANAAMEFNQKTLSPTYRFRKGVPGSSFAFEIAQRMNLPKDLLAKARDLLGEQRENLSRLLLSLEENLQAVQEEKRRLRKLGTEAKQERELYVKRSETFEEKREELLQAAYREADRIMSEANRKIEQAVEQIRTRGKVEKDSIRNVRRDVETHKKEIGRQLRPASPVTRRLDENPPVVGDRVRVQNSETSGELVELEGKRAVVLSGKLKITTTLDKLEKSAGKPKEDRIQQWMQTSHTTGYTKETISPSLNLRGIRGEEAVRTLTLYIDQAVASGLSSVDIIHGKGDGILRKLVHEHLSGRTEVVSFELAPWERGGPGCTIAHFN